MADIVTRLLEGADYEYDSEVMREAADEIERLRAALLARDDAVKVYATMEGPRYAGMSSEMAKKAWALTRAALGNTEEKQ